MFGIVEAPGVELESDPSIRYTILFNTFVFCQFFNEINCRKIKNEWNPFEGFFRNWICIAVLVLTTILQIIFVQFGGVALGTVPLGGTEWLFSIGLGASVIPVGLIGRMFLPPPDYDWVKYQRAQKGKESEEEDTTEVGLTEVKVEEKQEATD